VTVAVEDVAGNPAKLLLGTIHFDYTAPASLNRDSQLGLRLFRAPWGGAETDGMPTIELRGCGPPDGEETKGWEWDGESWKLVSDTGPDLELFGMAYDEARARMLAFGGHAQAGESDETWESSGASWHQVIPAGEGPGQRDGLAMVYDSKRGRIVLFGATITASTGAMISTCRPGTLT